MPADRLAASLATLKKSKDPNIGRTGSFSLINDQIFKEQENGKDRIHEPAEREVSNGTRKR